MEKGSSLDLLPQTLAIQRSSGGSTTSPGSGKAVKSGRDVETHRPRDGLGVAAGTKKSRIGGS